MLISLKNKHTLQIDDFYFSCSIGKNGISKKKIDQIYSKYKDTNKNLIEVLSSRIMHLYLHRFSQSTLTFFTYLGGGIGRRVRLRGV